MLAAQTS